MWAGKPVAADPGPSPRWPDGGARQQRHEPSVWRVGRWFHRRPATLYQRCLALHIYDAGKRTALN